MCLRSNYFLNLNSAGQALFIVGILLVFTFIVLLIVVLKPEKNKVKKIYGESAISDTENIFEEKMKNINNISNDDINLDNDKTRNLKSIVDELRDVEAGNKPSLLDKIEAYEDEQENTAIISVGELLKINKELFRQREIENTQVYSKPIVEKNNNDDLFMEDISDELTKPVPVNEIEEKKYVPRREIFSSVYTDTNEVQKEENNEVFLNSLKHFRNNL